MRFMGNFNGLDPERVDAIVKEVIEEHRADGKGSQVTRLGEQLAASKVFGELVTGARVSAQVFTMLAMLTSKPEILKEPDGPDVKTIQEGLVIAMLTGMVLAECAELDRMSKANG